MDTVTERADRMIRLLEQAESAGLVVRSTRRGPGDPPEIDVGIWSEQDPAIRPKRPGPMFNRGIEVRLHRATLREAEIWIAGYVAGRWME